MSRHISANLWLLFLTLLISAVLYPLALWGFGQAVFHDKANGSLVTDKQGQIVGSRLIAQPFAGAEYFQPRPSAVSYNGAAGGGTNWGANNPNLRKRVVGMLGTLLKYRDGRPVAPDIAAWTRENLQKDRSILTQWTETDPYLAERWGAANPDNLATWEKDHAAAVDAWKKDHPDAEITPPHLAALFFTSYAKGETQAWPESIDTDLATTFFELWWKAHPTADVAPVPADLVMASGAGLDPHITLAGAEYQLDRVAAAWAAKTKRPAADVKQEIEGLLKQNASAPLGGLVGVDLVNVLQVNLALRDKYGS